MIVIEGPDNAGKSTLAKHLSTTIGWRIQPSEGPAKSVLEINTRIRRYLDMNHTIFDRFPTISNPIYDAATGRESHRIDPWLVEMLYEQAAVFIYCDPLERGMSGHLYHDGVDTEEHLRQVRAGYDAMLQLYRSWAIQHAHFIYRIGDDTSIVINSVDHLINGVS